MVRLLPLVVLCCFGLTAAAPPEKKPSPKQLDYRVACILWETDALKMVPYFLNAHYQDFRKVATLRAYKARDYRGGKCVGIYYRTDKPEVQWWFQAIGDPADIVPLPVEPAHDSNPFLPGARLTSPVVMADPLDLKLLKVRIEKCLPDIMAGNTLTEIRRPPVGKRFRYTLSISGLTPPDPPHP